MARIRTIKPEFFRHEGLQDLELKHPHLRPMLVFAALWGHADANGIFPWQPRQLKLDILPFIPFDMADTLEALRSAGYVERYTVDGKDYGIIPTFSKHQRLSGKEAANGEKYPLPDEGSTCEAPVKHPGSNGENLESQELGFRNLGLGTWEEEVGTGEGGPGEGERSSADDPFLFSSGQDKNQNPLVVSIPADDGSCYEIRQSELTQLQKRFPRVDVRKELSDIAECILHKPEHRKDRQAVQAFAERWLKSADNFRK
jgi:hypothetical protein